MRNVVLGGIVGLLLGVALGFALFRVNAPPPETPTAPSGAVLLPPLHDAEPGEEIVIATGDGSLEHVFRVVSVTELEVEVERIKRRFASPVSRDVLRWSRNGFGIPEGWLIRSFTRDWVDVRGTRYAAWKVMVQSRSDGVRAYWISEEFPVNGVIKVARVLSGRVEHELGFEAVRWEFPEEE